MDSKKKALADIAAAMKPQHDEKQDVAAGSLSDLINAALKEPNAKKRKKMLQDFAARRSDVADFLSANEELINAEAEAALIGAAVGGTFTEKKVAYTGGRRQETLTKKHIPPNMAALGLYLKNRMPDKYSDKPQTEIEIEDLSEMEDMIYGGKDKPEDTEEKNDTV